jgi:tRNA (adenine57-N1/adenine58-N1)-methyltransferase
VVTYEIREDHHKIVKKNIEFMGMKNLTLKNKDVYEKIDEKNVDVINLDLPEPWDALDSCLISLKTGGYLVSYVPTIPQVMDFVKAIEGKFHFIKTLEIIEREWDVFGRKVRPKTQQIGHSGFLTFCRKL